MPDESRHHLKKNDGKKMRDVTCYFHLILLSTPEVNIVDLFKLINASLLY